MDKMTRRDLLKAIVAGSGGIVAAGFLPEKWLKPVVKSGVLPVHAQASAPQPTAVPDLFIRGGYYIYYGEDQETPPVVRAYAFVSSEDIPEFSFPVSFSKVLAFEYPEVDSPAKDVNVTLLVDGVKEEPTKITDENGFVEWNIDYVSELNGVNSIDPNEGAQLIFKLDNGKIFSVTVEAWD